MSSGKNKSLQKTREPYGKVTEVGQVPIALQEIKELALMAGGAGGKMPFLDQRQRLEAIGKIADSVIAVTCATPGCLSEMLDRQVMVGADDDPRPSAVKQCGAT